MTGAAILKQWMMEPTVRFRKLHQFSFPFTSTILMFISLFIMFNIMIQMRFKSKGKRQNLYLTVLILKAIFSLSFFGKLIWWNPNFLSKIVKYNDLPRFRGEGSIKRPLNIKVTVQIYCWSDSITWIRSIPVHQKTCNSNQRINATRLVNLKNAFMPLHEQFSCLLPKTDALSPGLRVHFQERQSGWVVCSRSWFVREKTNQVIVVGYYITILLMSLSGHLFMMNRHPEELRDTFNPVIFHVAFHRRLQGLGYQEVCINLWIEQI